ncbi:hypothetical protein GF351_03490 [Candidatus Woesearchaeota archaeon]|nr:hypothetical protein [Candidatus Woesearchaeota archaeon]
MDAFECIQTRRSIRKFLDVPVEWDKIGSLLEAARLAPNAGNLQNWQFMIVFDKEKRKKLAEACLQQYWMQTAPIHVIITATVERGKQFYSVRGERLYNVQNCAAAAENMLLAAHALGLGGCWVGAFDEDMVKRTCSIPDRARPQMILAIGYPDEQPPCPPKRTLENVTFMNNYGENSGRIRDIDQVMGYQTASAIRSGIEKGKKMLGKFTQKVKEPPKE